jgi:hypothetical protein
MGGPGVIRREADRSQSSAAVRMIWSQCTHAYEHEKDQQAYGPGQSCGGNPASKPRLIAIGGVQGGWGHPALCYRVRAHSDSELAVNSWGTGVPFESRRVSSAAAGALGTQLSDCAGALVAWAGAVAFLRRVGLAAAAAFGAVVLAAAAFAGVRLAAADFAGADLAGAGLAVIF